MMKKQNDKLNISVVIPAYNEEKDIGECLKSLVADTYKNKEIIVINDSSTDKTKEIVKKFKQIRLINNKKNEGIVKSIKRGIDTSKGEIVVKINADCIIPKKLFNKLAKYFEDKEVIAVTGNYKPKNKNNIIRSLEIIDGLFLNKLKRFFSLSRLSGTCWAARRNMITSFDFWKKAKKTDEGNLYLELKNKGKIIYDKDLIVRGVFPESLLEVWKRKFKWGENSVKDRYYVHFKFWLRPVYFFLLILSLIFVYTFLGKILLFLVFLPLITLFFFSLFKRPCLCLLVPSLLLFSEFAWICGVIKEFLRQTS